MFLGQGAKAARKENALHFQEWCSGWSRGNEGISSLRDQAGETLAGKVLFALLDSASYFA